MILSRDDLKNMGAEDIEIMTKEPAANSRCPASSGSVPNVLFDARKAQISMHGYALLQWSFNQQGFANHSVQMPEVVIDQILEWRDIHLQNTKIAHSEQNGE